MTKASDVGGDWGAATEQMNTLLKEQVKRNAIDHTDPDRADDGAPVVASNEKFPDDYRQCLPLLRERQEAFDRIPSNRENRSKRMQASKDLERLKAHVFAIQQGNRAPVVSMNTVRAAEFNHNTTAPTQRELEINRLRLVRKLVLDLKDDVFAPILRHSLSRLPKEHKNIARNPREVLLADSGCRDQLHVLLVAAGDAQTKKLELFNVTNISDRKAELKQCLDGSKDADEVEAIQAELVKLRSPEAEHIAILRRREVTPLVEFANEVSSAFLKWAIGSLESCHAEAVRFEESVFADLSLPREETIISRRYKQAIAELRQLQTPLRVLGWFGMPSLTHVAEQHEQATK